MATKNKTKTPTLAALSTVPEIMNTAGSGRELCMTCARGGEYLKPYVPKDYNGGMLFVFEYPPTKDEVSLMGELAAKAGIERVDVAYTYAVRCGSQDIPSMKHIRCCRPYLMRILDVLSPRRVVALGPSAMRSLTNSGTTTNVTKLRGRPLVIPEYKEIPAYGTYNPRSILLGGLQYRDRIVEDLNRQAQVVIQRPAAVYPTGLDIAIDTEYAPDKSLLTVGIANRSQAVSTEPSDHGFYEILGEIVHAPDAAVLMGHSLSGDVDQLVTLGLARPCWVTGEMTSDSLLLSRMKDENRGKGGYDLESLLVSNRNVAPWKQDTELYSKTDATKWPEDLRRERCRLDAWASATLVDSLRADPEIKTMPVELTHRIAMSLHRIRHAGVYISKDTYHDIAADLLQERELNKAKLTTLAMSNGMASFTPTNDDDIRTLLYRRMKLPVLRKTKKSKLASVDKTTLKQYQDRPEVQALMAFNTADKAYSTNIEGLKDLLVDKGRHYWMAVNINPLGARTGRRSSSSPNMQNWPSKMRQMVVSRFPDGRILEFDYKSLEVFLLANEANDDKLYDYFANRGGYIAVAKDMWKVDVTKGSTEYRATKSVVLGTNYNMQSRLMAENLWMMGVRFSADYKEHERQTDTLRNAYLDMFPGLRPYMARQEKFLQDHGYVVTKTGRVRHLPVEDEDTPGYYRMVNQAINYPIQGLAADVTGSALIDCEAALCDRYNVGIVEYHAALMGQRWPEMPLIINEVHDNLVFDLPFHDERRVNETVALLKERMESVETLRKLVPSFTMPVKVDMKLGLHWGVED